MIVELYQLLWLCLTQVGDVQGVVVVPKSVPIVLPGHTVLPQPAVGFELTAGEDNVYTADRVRLAPDVYDALGTASLQEVLEIHLMEHPLDVGHPNLEGGVGVAAAAGLVHHLGVLFGDEAHAVKAGDVQIFQRICPVEGSRLSALPQGDDRGSLHSLGWIVYDDDPVIFVNADAVHPGSAGEHEAVVGVEFTELASAQFHIQHDPLAHGLIEIRPDEGETGLAAHAGGALKGHIAAGAAAEVQGNPLGTEHISGLLPANLLRLPGSAPVKDPGEVHIEQHIGKSRDLLLTTLPPALPVELVHQLVEHGAAVLLVLGTRYLAVLGGTAVQSKGVNAVFLRGIAHHRPGREFVDLIGRHWLTSVCSILPQTISKSKRILLPLLLRWELFVFKFLKWRY